MAKKTKELTLEEKLEQALIPVDEQPYEVPENWCWAVLDSLSEVISKGTTPKGGKDAYVDDGVNFLRVENFLDDGTISTDEMKHITENVHFNELKRSILLENDVLVSIAGSLGKTAIVDKTSLPLNTNQAVAFIRLLDTAKVNPKYLRLYLASPMTQELLLGKTKVTSIPNLTLKIISDTPIALPPLAEQQRIVDRIESLFAKLDEAKDKVESVLNNTDNRKSAMLFQAMSRELTKKWREQNGYSKNNWEKYTIEEICENIVDCPHSTPSWTEEGVLCLRTTNIKQGYLDLSETQFVSNETYVERTERLIPKAGDLIFTREGSVGDVAIVPENVQLCMGQRMMLMRTNEKCRPQYLLYYLTSPFIRNHIKASIMGTTAPRMNIKDIKKLSIMIPTLSEQDEIINNLIGTIENYDEIEKIIDNIDQMKKSILSKAFRGLLDTNNCNDERAIDLLRLILGEN